MPLNKEDAQFTIWGTWRLYATYTDFVDFVDFDLLLLKIFFRDLGCSQWYPDCLVFTGNSRLYSMNMFIRCILHIRGFLEFECPELVFNSTYLGDDYINIINTLYNCTIYTLTLDIFISTCCPVWQQEFCWIHLIGFAKGYTHFVVYTRSSFVEQTTPNSLSFAAATAKYQAIWKQRNGKVGWRNWLKGSWSAKIGVVAIFWGNTFQLLANCNLGGKNHLQLWTKTSQVSSQLWRGSRIWNLCCLSVFRPTRFWKAMEGFVIGNTVGYMHNWITPIHHFS